MAYAIAGEIPALIFVYFSIDKERLGRKKPLIFAFSG